MPLFSPDLRLLEIVPVAASWGQSNNNDELPSGPRPAPRLCVSEPTPGFSGEG